VESGAESGCLANFHGQDGAKACGFNGYADLSHFGWNFPLEATSSTDEGCHLPRRPVESVVSNYDPGGCMSVEQKVKQIIVEQLGVDEAQVDATASFVDDLGADSLDIVELVMAFEEAFDLDIPDEDAEKIATVKNAIDYIESKKK